MTQRQQIDSSISSLVSGHHPRQCSGIWRAEAPQNWKELLSEALRPSPGAHVPEFFFRADDIAAGGRAFEALCRLFRAYEVPLAMAVVPGWLSDSRLENLFRVAPREEPLWNWHQHGWRHVNWQEEDKKSEFGKQRTQEKQLKDLLQGKQKMSGLFGEYFVDVFTPPWNRLSPVTLDVLQEIGFKGVSLMGPFPRGAKSDIQLKNLRVQIDLHTRKNKNGSADYLALCEEIAAIMGRREPVGIMLHHQRMNGFAFQFLEELLRLLKARVNTKFLSFKDLLEEEGRANGE